MKIKWFGHASFLIISDSGIRIITDPYETGKDLTYDEVTEPADIVTVSHDHFDHNNIAPVQGSPQVVQGTAEAKGIRFKGIPVYHDETGGSQRGGNTIFCFEVDGVKVCHLGDLGHPLSDAQLAELGAIDVLLIPVGGYFTIEPDIAGRLCDQLKPRVIIPMHFKTDKCHLPIKGLKYFLKGKAGVTRLDSSEVEFKAGTLPASMQIVVLKPAN